MSLPPALRRVWPEPADDVPVADAYAMADDVVRANMVMTLDGAAAFAGRAGPLSNPVDFALLLFLRRLADVVLVGAGTVRAEGYGPVRVSPEMQERRTAAGLAPVPPIAVVTASLDLDPESPFFREATARPIVLTTSAAPADRRTALSRVAEVVDAGDVAVDVHAAVQALRARGLRRILCEGGPTVLAQLSAAGLLDELCLTLSPRLVGPGGGAPLPLAAPVDLRLRQALEHDGFLYLRYARA